MSCSEYGKQAIAEHGVINGYLLLRQRFGECSSAAAQLYLQPLRIADNGCGDGAGKSCYKGCNDGARKN